MLQLGNVSTFQIHVLGDDFPVELAKVIPRDQLPLKLGGTCDCDARGDGCVGRVQAAKLKAHLAAHPPTAPPVAGAAAAAAAGAVGGAAVAAP
jgi:hypothetical protein